MKEGINKSKLTVISLLAIAVIAILIIVLVVFKDLGLLGSSKLMKDFYRYYNSNERTVIYYAATGCGYCEYQTPILETISDDYNVDYLYLDSTLLSRSEKNKVLKLLGIEHATPTTVIVEDKEVIDTAIGYTQGNDYVKFLIEGGILEKDSKYSAEANINYINYNKYNRLISENGTNIIVLGQTTCSHCIALKPALNEVAGTYDLVINYLDLTELTEDEYNSFTKTLTDIKYNDPDFVSDGSFGTPLILIVKNGKVSHYISGERTISQMTKEFKKFGLIK